MNMLGAMRWALVAFLLLSGCAQSASDKARSDLAFLKAHDASKPELCDAYGKLVDADLAEHNSQAYDLDRVERDVACNEVALERSR